MLKLRFLVLFFTLIGCSFSFLHAQSIQSISGIITDAETLHPLPYTNLVLNKTKTGTTSSSDGSFQLQTRNFPDTIIVSAIGYETKYIPILSYSDNFFEIALIPKDFELDEIVVTLGENPAIAIMKNVIDYKDDNNPLNAKSYASNTYTKIMVRTQKAEVDSSAIIQKSGLPIYFSEKVSQNIYQKDPYIEKGEIIAEKQEGLGFLNEMNIIGYSNNMSIDFTFYDNVIELMDKPFISPLNSRAMMFYKYYLRDSITTALGKEYLIDFKPKNKRDLAFTGSMKIMDEKWTIHEIEASIPQTANLNYINRLQIKHTFKSINDSMTFFESNEMNADFKITKDNSLFDIDFTGKLNKKSVYRDVIVNFETIQPGEEAQIFENLLPQKKQLFQKDLVKQHRPDELTLQELQAIETIDSLNNSWKIRSADALSRMFITGYIPGDYFELGPFLELIKKNKVEGFRYTFSGRTSAELTKDVMLYGSAGFGTRDKEWKYSGGFKYKLPGDKRKLFTLEYRDDLSKIGDNGSIFLIKENMMVTGEDNVIASIFTSSPLDKISREIRYTAKYENEFKRGVTGIVDYQYKSIYSGQYMPFVSNRQVVNSFDVNQVTLGLRLSWRENFTDNYCRRFYMSTKYPIINLRATFGQYELKGSFDEFVTLRGVINHDINVGQTKLEYLIESGITLGTVPFPLLEIHRTDQSLGYALYSFNMMNEMEFASDRFVSLMSQYHLNGTLFNRIPLLRQLGFREVISTKILYSYLDDKHKTMLAYPVQFYHANNVPYIEVSAGVENVFQYFRFDVVWRLTHNQNPNTYPVGIRARFDVNF